MNQKKLNPMLITFEDLPKEERWNRCMDALRTDYTLTTKEICKVVKCSRVWANKFITPHLHYIHMSNGAGKGRNFLYAAKICLKNGDMTATNYYHRGEFEELIRENLGSATRQTIKVAFKNVMEPAKYAEFMPKYLENRENLVTGMKSLQDVSKIKKALDELIENHLNENGQKLWKDAPSMFKRTNTQAIPVELPEDLNIYMDLVAIHDIKDYGDTDEEIFRRLFSMGAIRMVLKLPDQQGVISEKIYYTTPDDTSAAGFMAKYSNYVSIFNNIK